MHIASTCKQKRRAYRLWSYFTPTESRLHVSCAISVVLCFFSPLFITLNNFFMMTLFRFFLFSSFCGLLQFPGVTRSKSFQQLSLFLCHKYPQVRLNAELKKKKQPRLNENEKTQGQNHFFLLKIDIAVKNRFLSVGG